MWCLLCIQSDSSFSRTLDVDAGRRGSRRLVTAATNGEGGGVEEEKKGIGGIFLEALDMDQKKVRQPCAAHCHHRHPHLGQSYIHTNIRHTQVGIMMGCIIIAQLILDETLSQVEAQLGQSSRMLVAEVGRRVEIHQSSS